MPDEYDDDDTCDETVYCDDCGCEYDISEYDTCPECGHHDRDRGSENYSSNVIDHAEYNFAAAESVATAGRIRMGYELEMTAPNAKPSLVARDPLNTAFVKLRDEFPFARKYCITKSDGSIHGPNPAELCTIPMTVTEHSRVLYRAFPEGRIGGNSLRMWSNSSCGMHIHIGVFQGRSRKRQASMLTIGKLMVFINEPRNELFWVDMCGRGSNSYAHFRRAKVSDYGRLTRTARFQEMHGRVLSVPSLQRYEALNLTNGSTMEFRLPRPTARITSVLKNLELFESALAWVKDVGANDPFFYESFLRWLAKPERRKSYTYLHSWLAKKKSPVGNKYRSYL